MERDLVHCVGAAIQVLAAGLGLEAPSGSVERGYEFVAHLAQVSDESRLDGIVTGAVRQVWAEWRLTGLPRTVAARHIAGLAALLEAYRPEPQGIKEALTSASATAFQHTHRRDRRAAIAQATRVIASHVADSAARDGVLAARGLSRELSYCLLEQLFLHLLRAHQALRELQPAMATYFADLRREVGRPADPGAATI